MPKSSLTNHEASRPLLRPVLPKLTLRCWMRAVLTQRCRIATNGANTRVGERSRARGLWSAEQLLNGAWSPLFSGKHLTRAALVDTGLLLLTLGALQNEARKVDRLSAALLAPYVAWTGFALYINRYIVQHDPRWLLRA